MPVEYLRCMKLNHFLADLSEILWDNTLAYEMNPHFGYSQCHVRDIARGGPVRSGGLVSNYNSIKKKDILMLIEV